MIDVVIFIVLVGFYFCLEGSETSLKEAGIAMGFYGMYLLVRYLVSPYPVITSQHMGLLYGFLPLLSFAAILFPSFNRHYSAYVTKLLGWIGLATVALILSFFKLFVW